jgi:hypothetical protein
VNEAKVAKFDAWQILNLAEAHYEAINDISNDGIYEYTGSLEPGAQIDENDFKFITIEEEIENLEGEVNALTTGVTALFNIASAVQSQFNTVTTDQKVDITELQTAYNTLIAYDNTLPGTTSAGGSIAELNFTKNILEQVLKAGKVGLQVVIDAFDAEIAELEEKIEVYTKIAEIYKAVMNVYLGIVDDETGPLDGETGPLDGEGDDEE